VKPSEVRELIRLRRPVADRTTRVLARCHDVDMLRAAARRRLPRAVFDYVDGGSEEEVTMAANRAALQSFVFHPRLLVDVAEVDLSVQLFGRQLPVPLGLAPTGYTAMMHHDGELAVARAAAAAGIPYALSTVGTRTVEQLASTGSDNWWFQLYVLRDLEAANALLERAERAGAAALEITLDTAVPAQRTRDLRNGLTIPPELSLWTIADIAAHVGYWLDMLRAPPLRFANLVGTRSATSVSLGTQFNSALNWRQLDDLRRRWPRTLIVKGPFGPDDSRRAVDAGVDAIHLSNHGGRQLDRCVPSIELVAPARAAVGPGFPLLLDSGIRTGADIALALALGADACLVGRPYLYGLAVGGEAGVTRMIDILSSGLRRTLQLLGVTSIDELKKQAGELVSRR